MKLISWNVNGLRAVLKKGFLDYYEKMDADIFALQETKMQESQLEIEFPNRYYYFNDAEKKGYSGTLVITKIKPLNVYRDFELVNKDIHNDEGRILTLEYENFYFVDVYVPNSKDGLLRLPYRQTFDKDFCEYLVSLRFKKPTIVCGDFNVAHEPIDLKNPESNTKNPGFSIEERVDFTNLLLSGFVDTYRYKNPNTVKYTWWSYRFNSREKNIGWRIDYFLVSENIIDKVTDIKIDDGICGSDHCPVVLEVDL